MTGDPNEFPVFENVVPKLRLTGSDAGDAAYTPPASPEASPLTEADYTLPSSIQFSGGPYSFNGSVPLYGQMATASYPDSLIPPESVSSPALTGAFYGMYVDGSGDTYLQGGSVVGSLGGSVTLADKKIIDHATGPIFSDGHLLALYCTCHGHEADGVLLPGLTVNSVVYNSGAITSLPANALPTADNTAADLYLELGRFAAGVFMPSGLGSFFAGFCVGGGFNISRV
jgi:hypothetical protein